jgi:phage FluMu protein Com
MIMMISISELRVCKACGNVFSKKAGVTNILECPQCKQTNFDTVNPDPEELTQE